MIRLSALFILIGLVLELVVVVRTTGQTAIAFSFVGMPALAVGIVFYLLALRNGRSGTQGPG